MNNAINDGSVNDSIVKATMCLQFTRAMSSVPAGTPFTPYMANIANAIMGAEGGAE